MRRDLPLVPNALWFCLVLAQVGVSQSPALNLTEYEGR
jgi:hypothetical protein